MRLLCPWDSPGVNTGVGFHALLQGSSQPRDRTCISYVSCIGRQVLYHLCHPESPYFTVQFSSVTQSCLTLSDPMDCSTPGLPVHHQLPELAQLLSIESVMPSNHLILCCPLLLLPSIFPSIRVFSNESVLCIRWPKYWGFSFSISPSNEYSGLISFRLDWFDHAVQGTLKSLLQHHSSKASILRGSRTRCLRRCRSLPSSSWAVTSTLFLGMACWAKRSNYLKPRAEEERRLAAEEKKPDEQKHIEWELAEAQEDTILK